MYADPRYSRRNVVATRVNDDELEWLNREAERLRTQPGTLLRELIEAAREGQQYQRTSTAQI